MVMYSEAKARLMESALGALRGWKAMQERNHAASARLAGGLHNLPPLREWLDHEEEKQLLDAVVNLDRLEAALKQTVDPNELNESPHAR